MHSPCLKTLLVFVLSATVAQASEWPPLQLHGLWLVDSETWTFVDGTSKAESRSKRLPDNKFYVILSDRLISLQFGPRSLRIRTDKKIMAHAATQNTYLLLLQAQGAEKARNTKLTIRQRDPNSVEFEYKLNEILDDVQLADGSVLSGESLSLKSGIVSSIRSDPQDWVGLIGNALEHHPKLVEDKELSDVLLSWLSTAKPASRGESESGAAVIQCPSDAVQDRSPGKQ